MTLNARGATNSTGIFNSISVKLLDSNTRVDSTNPGFFNLPTIFSSVYDALLMTLKIFNLSDTQLASNKNYSVLNAFVRWKCTVECLSFVCTGKTSVIDSCTWRAEKGGQRGFCELSFDTIVPLSFLWENNASKQKLLCGSHC